MACELLRSVQIRSRGHPERETPYGHAHLASHAASIPTHPQQEARHPPPAAAANSKAPPARAETEAPSSSYRLANSRQSFEPVLAAQAQCPVSVDPRVSRSSLCSVRRPYSSAPYCGTAARGRCCAAGVKLICLRPCHALRSRVLLPLIFFCLQACCAAITQRPAVCEHSGPAPAGWWVDGQ